MVQTVTLLYGPDEKGTADDALSKLEEAGMGLQLTISCL